MISLPTSWISPTAFDAFKMIARSFGCAFNLKAWIGGADEAAIRRRGTGEAAASPNRISVFEPFHARLEMLMR